MRFWKQTINKFLFILGIFLLLGMSPQDELIDNASNKTVISNETLISVAISNAKKINEPIVFIDGETAEQLDEVYQLAKDYSSFNNPMNKFVNEFFLPERLSRMTILEIVDIPLTFTLFGGIATKTITKAPKAITKAPKAITVGKVLSQGERYQRLLTRHRILHEQINILWKDYWKVLIEGKTKKAWRILQEIHRTTKELAKIEKKLTKLLSEWDFFP